MWFSFGGYCRAFQETHVIRLICRPFDYCHINPVKHGLVKNVSDWPYSTFHRYVGQGLYTHRYPRVAIADFITALAGSIKTGNQVQWAFVRVAVLGNRYGASKHLFPSDKSQLIDPRLMRHRHGFGDFTVRYGGIGLQLYG